MSAVQAYATANATPRARVVLATCLAVVQSLRADVRELATRITARDRDVWRQSPRTIVEWMRRHMTYVRETPGVELLQGAETTIALRLGDCDDLALTYAALAQSIGLRCVVAGLTRPGCTQARVFVHAVPYLPGYGMVEPTDDRRYSGRPTTWHVTRQGAAGRLAYWYDPLDGRHYVAPASELLLEVA